VKKRQITATGKIKHGVAVKALRRLISHNAKYIRQDSSSVLSAVRPGFRTTWAPYGLMS
jgi:large subunit ribosomal protein L35